VNKEFLTSLGYSEESAKVVVDFLGERVTTMPESYNNKKKRPTPVITTKHEDI
jgi:hypothetical protein